MLRKIIGYILSFALAVSLIVSIAITTLSHTILNEKYVLSIIEKSEYYSNMYDEIMENFENNTIQSGLTEEVLDGIITEEKVYNDINTLITYLYSDVETLEIETDSVEANLRANIDIQLEENGITTLTKSQQEDVDDYVKTIVNIYRSSIMYFENYMEPVQNVINLITTNINKVKITSYTASILLILVVLLVNNKKSITYIAISAIASGTFLIVIKCLESIFLQVGDITLFNSAFSLVLVTLIGNIMTYLLVFGIVFFVLGIGLSCLTSKLK